MNILLVASGAREHALARSIKKSKHYTALFCFAQNTNQGIKPLCKGYTIGNILDPHAIAAFAKKNNINLAIIGPEAPLEAGVADALWNAGIPTVGPKKILAQIETSKSFTRNLLQKYNIPGSPRFKYFTNMDGVEHFMNELSGNYVVKADGLAGGKGVKVSGEHLSSIADGLAHCESVIAEGKTFLIEEKLIGEEFSLISITDGEHTAHTPAVQDHKRAFEGDTGPNTGGMGTYSDANHSLPFLTDADIREARTMNEHVIAALKAECGEPYQGILYGGFMSCKTGVGLIEYNARFGDPEAMNLLPLLESDFVDMCIAITNGTLSANHVRFSNKASVCKYAVPNGYPDNPTKGDIIDVSHAHLDALYFGAVDEKDKTLITTGSRAIAVVGIAGTIAEAEKIAETEIKKIQGPLMHRKDIGTRELIEKRVARMKELRA